MIDWIGHQLKVWSYGAGVLMILAIAALISAVPGTIAAVLVSWAFDWPLNGFMVTLFSLVAAPFFLPDIASRIAEIVRTNPPPREIDLLRQRTRKGKV